LCSTKRLGWVNNLKKKSMSGIYKNDTERVSDQILANSVKMFSANFEGKLVPASEYEKAVHKELKSKAITKLAIDKAMTD